MWLSNLVRRKYYQLGKGEGCGLIVAVGLILLLVYVMAKSPDSHFAQWLRSLGK